MKKLKTIILGILLVGTATSFAQKTITISPDFKKQETIQSSKVTPQSIASKQTKKMTKLLGLSAEQTRKVGQLNLKVQEKIAVIKNSKRTEEGKQEFIKGNQRDRLNTLSTILTKEQFEKYKATL